MEVATDERFGRWSRRRKGLVAAGRRDHVVKVKVTGLAARTRYYYRFRTTRAGGSGYSPVGRTLTAPSFRPAGTHPAGLRELPGLRGRYYNAWQQLVERNQDLDLVLFIGDYIYETASAPTQGGDPSRAVGFSDPGSAMSIAGDQVARSLSN